MGYAEDLDSMQRGWDEVKESETEQAPWHLPRGLLETLPTARPENVQSCREQLAEALGDVKAIVHCSVCRSSFMGFGETTDAAASEAVESLAAHRAKYHAVSK